jgi:hypothetical protein
MVHVFVPYSLSFFISFIPFAPLSPSLTLVVLSHPFQLRTTIVLHRRTVFFQCDDHSY